MKIDISKFKRVWDEDRNGNEIDWLNDKDKYDVTYHRTCFPCQITEEVDKYGYHPTGINRALIKLPIIGNIVKHKIGKSFKHLYSINCTLGSESQKTAVAMVNSGDYELDEALWILANACERCDNVLARKYLGEDHGYEEYSEEWSRCNTVCDFCVDDFEEE